MLDARRALTCVLRGGAIGRFGGGPSRRIRGASSGSRVTVRLCDCLPPSGGWATVRLCNCLPPSGGWATVRLCDCLPPSGGWVTVRLCDCHCRAAGDVLSGQDRTAHRRAR
eukprot:1195406-Prorocentrum_minimum.AAC.1